MASTKGVITGDFVQSTKLNLEDRQSILKSLTSSFKTLNKSFPLNGEVFRGDSFQCVIHNVKYSLRVALILKTFIRSLNPSELVQVKKKQGTSIPKITLQTNWITDARIAIGVGPVESLTKSIGSSNGTAFVLSGHLLDRMKNSKNHFLIETYDLFRDEIFTESILLDAILSKTSALQCEVIYLKLLGYNETNIANKLKINQSAVNQRSTSGNWNAIEAMVDRFEQIYSE